MADRITFVAVSGAEQRAVRALTLEPGGPPTAKARVVNQVIKVTMKNLWQHGPESAGGLRTIRRAFDVLSRFEAIPHRVRIHEEPFDGHRPLRHRTGGAAALSGCSEWVRAGLPDERRPFLYLHGGGYFFGSPRLYRPFNWRLSASTGRPVLALDYRLAPENTPADALEDALRAYDHLLAKGHAGRDIVVGGDSAGGHLTLALLLALKERGTPLPAAAVCLSPWVDLLCSAESHRLNRRRDALIPTDKLAWLGGMYCRDKEEGDPLFSPLRGDLNGLPPLMFVASGTEILRDDTRAAVKRARAAGVETVHHEWDGLVHVFPVFADYIPEGRAAFRHIAEFLRRVAPTATGMARLLG